MSSKRSLYKPAPSSGGKSSEKIESRRPLVQGRLVNSVLPDSMTLFASPSSTKQSVTNTSRESPTITATYEDPVMQGPWTPPREAMADYSPVGESAKSTIDHNGKRSPPRSISSFHEPQSPPKPAPSRALDLSDSEIELNARKHVHSEVGRERGAHDSVLMVDASGSRLDLQDTEVMVRTGMVRSPAKVICHAPSEGQEPDPRDTGSVEIAAKIPVDQIPSIVQTAGGLHHTVNSRDVEVDPDHPSDTIPTREHPTASSARELPFEDTEESVMSDMADMNESLALKDALISRGDSIDSSRAERDSSNRERRKKKPTKTTGRIVPSRYMQSFSKTSSTTQPTVRSRSASRTAVKTVKQSDKLMKKPPQKPAPITGLSTARTKKPKSRRSMMPTVFSETPMERGAGGKDMFTSTPAMDGSFFPDHLPIDTSAMTGVSNISAISHDMSVFREDPAADLGSRFDDTRDSITMYRKTKKGKKGDVHPQKELTQFDLDKMYARYIQWVFLESKIRKEKQDREKEAMSQLYLLHQENESLNDRKAELEMKLSRLTHANNLDQLLDIQKSGLGPIGSHLQQFQSEYTTLAEALDTTRHQIRTTGIHLPQNEDLFQDELLSALSESEQLLNNISSVLHEKVTKTSTFAKTLKALDKAVEAEDKELKRCQQLLAKTSINTTHETSLRVHQIENRIAD